MSVVEPFKSTTDGSLMGKVLSLAGAYRSIVSGAAVRVAEAAICLQHVAKAVREMTGHVRVVTLHQTNVGGANFAI